MRMFVGSLATETNTFAPLPVDRAAFESAFYAPPGTHPDTPTLCSAPMIAARRRARQEGFTLIEGTSAWAEPAGLVSRAAFEGLRDEILDQLRAALPVDIALFGLHGAMVADGYEDCEGDLLARAREIVGPGAVIGAEYDLHCHLTEKRIAACDVVVLFKEFPHTDFLARAEDLVDLALRTARGEIKPVMAMFDCRTLSAAFMTNQPVGRAFIDRIMAMEGKDGVLSISLAHGFSAGDVPEVGFRVLVTTDGDKAKAAALAERIGREVLAMGRTATPRHYKPEEAIALARSAKEWPQVFGDRWDSPGGGVPGDSTIMIETLLRHPDLPSAIGVTWDPDRGRVLPRRRRRRQSVAAHRGQGDAGLRSASRRACRREGGDRGSRHPLRAEHGLARAGGRGLGRQCGHRHRQQACPDLQPARLHQSRDRPLQEGHRDREVVEPFLCGIFQDCGSDPLSRTPAARFRTIPWR